MPSSDSIAKIVTTYFSALNVKPFLYDGTMYPVKPLVVSPCLFRGYSCPPGCGACCPKFSLDYISTEPLPSKVKTTPRMVSINGVKALVLSDAQSDNKGRFCRNVRREDGRCSVHGQQPFSCDFEIVRFKHYKDKAIVGTFLYGRAWNMLRVVDNDRGAKCEIEEFSDGVRDDLLRKFKRVSTWMKHWNLDTSRVEKIIELVNAGKPGTV